MTRFSKILFFADSLPANLRLYSVAHLIFRAVGLARMVLLTWILEQTQFGLLSVGLAFVNITAAIVLLGAPSALERYIPLYQNTHRLKAFLRRIIPVCLAIVVLGVALLALNIRFVASLVFSLTTFGPANLQTIHQFSQLTAACIAAVAAAACFHMIVSCLKGLRFFRAVAALELTHAFLFTALAVALLLGYLRQPVVVLAAQALSMALTAALLALLLLLFLRASTEQNQSLASTRYLSRFAAFAVWGLPGTITWRLLLVFPLWYLNRTHGPGTTGTYWAYFTLVNIIFFLSVPFWSVMNIHTVRRWVQAKYELARTTVELGFRAFSLFLLLMCLALTVAAPLFSRLFPAGFAAGAQHVRFLCLPALLAANFGLVHLLAHLLERPGLRVLALTFGTVCLLAAGYLLIPTYGITGAALSAALGLSLATILGLAMLASRRCYLSISTWIVLVCPALLLIPNYYLMLGSFVLLILLVVFSPLFFSAHDKQYAIDSFLQTLRRFWSKRSSA
ncbi:MAG: oligosaccharide flippase family protein [Phycisphaerae bacterium]|nr:oligosaccharide flippase family protein [Phycisphaerae bacterium]